MSAVAIRRATAADAAVIADVYLASRRDAEPRIPPIAHAAADVHAWIARVVLAEHDVRVAEGKGRVVAMMALAGDSLEHLYVLPAFQGQGIGARLLDLAKRLSPRRLRLRTFQANRPARDFYEARGFVAVEFGDGAGNEERAPDVLYEWTGGA